MKLEDAIRQRTFKSEIHKTVVNIYFTNYWLQEDHGNVFKKFGLTGQQFNILRILRGQFPTPVTINLLIERMLNKMCDASRLVEKLRQKGLVERVQNNEDKRAVNVLITENGLRILEEIDPILDLKYKAWEENLSEEESIQLNMLLDKLRQTK